MKSELCINGRAESVPCVPPKAIRNNGLSRKFTQITSFPGARAVILRLKMARCFAEIITSPRVTNNLYEQHHLIIMDGAVSLFLCQFACKQIPTLNRVRGCVDFSDGVGKVASSPKKRILKHRTHRFQRQNGNVEIRYKGHSTFAEYGKLAAEPP